MTGRYLYLRSIDRFFGRTQVREVSFLTSMTILLTMSLIDYMS